MFNSATSQQIQEKINSSLTNKEKSRNIDNRKPATLHVLPNAPQNYYQKLIPKEISQSYVIETCFAHSKVQNYSSKLLPKILPEICSPKLVPEAAPEQLSTTPKLVPNAAVPKNAPESNSLKLFKIACK